MSGGLLLRIGLMVNGRCLRGKSMLDLIRLAADDVFPCPLNLECENLSVNYKQFSIMYFVNERSEDKFVYTVQQNKTCYN